VMYFQSLIFKSFSVALELIKALEFFRIMVLILRSSEPDPETSIPL
jgi:hypothetical protein